MLLNFKKLKVGHRLLGVVKQVNDYDLVVSLPSHLTGFVSVEEVSANFAERFEAAAEDEGKDMPVLKQVYKPGQLLMCAIASVQQKPKKRVELSLRASVLNAGVDVALDLVPGALLAAEVQAVEDRGYRVSFGLPCSETVGFLPADDQAGRLHVGQTVPVWVRSVDSRLVLVSSRMGACPLVNDAPVGALLRPGALVTAEVTGHDAASSSFLRVKFTSGLEGRVDLFQLPGDIAHRRCKGLDLAEHFPVGHKFRARLVFCDGEERRFLLSGRDAIVGGEPLAIESPLAFTSPVEDCSVLRVDPAHGLLLSVAGSPLPAYVHISQLTDEHLERVSGAAWKVDTRHACRIVDYDPFDGILIGCTRPSVLREAFVRLDEVRPGQLVRGTVARVESYGLLVQLTAHIRGLCPRDQLTEVCAADAPSRLAVGAKLRFRVLDVDVSARRITLSRKAGLIASDLPPLTSLADARIGAHHDGYIAAIRDCGLLVRFYAGVKGLMPVAECSDEFQARPQDAFFPGQVIRCRVIKCDAEAGELNLSLRKTLGPKKGMEKGKKGQHKEVTEPPKPETRKRSAEAKVADAPVAETLRAKRVRDAAPMTLDDLVEVEPCSPKPEASSISPKPKAPSKDSDPGAPSLRDICDEFEKRLIGQPNSSFLWIQYMSALLRASEPEAARATAERALTTIKFRDVQEKLNVWIAFMNLERAAGTSETLKKVFERACVYADPKAVHIQLAKIYEETKGAAEEADLALDLHRVMCKKYGQSCKAWVGHMLYLYSCLRDTTAARKLLPQALKSLPKRKHVKITCKTAQLEYKYGSVERARTIFEGVLANAPKRVDIWSVYLTMEENRVGPADVEHVRRLFERIVHLRMSSKKAKFFFKRFLDFEKTHGSDAGVEHVKELARNYVESNMSN